MARSSVGTLFVFGDRLLPDVGTRIGVCRYCHRPLRELAQQCFTCGWSWHAGKVPEQRGPIDWNRLGIRGDVNYVGDLCETERGERYIEFRRFRTFMHNPDFVIDTREVSKSQLLEWRMVDLEKRLCLSDGSSFRFDERGYWQASSASARSGKIEREWRGSTAGLLTAAIATELAAMHAQKCGIELPVERAELRDINGRPMWQLMLVAEAIAGVFDNDFLWVDAQSGLLSCLVKRVWG